MDRKAGDMANDGHARADADLKSGISGPCGKSRALSCAFRSPARRVGGAVRDACAFGQPTNGQGHGPAQRVKPKFGRVRKCFFDSEL